MVRLGSVVLSGPAGDEEIFLEKTTAVAAAAVETAGPSAGSGVAPASRCGVIRTTAVPRLTVLQLLRIRCTVEAAGA